MRLSQALIDTLSPGLGIPLISTGNKLGLISTGLIDGSRRKRPPDSVNAKLGDICRPYLLIGKHINFSRVINGHQLDSIKVGRFPQLLG